MFIFNSLLICLGFIAVFVLFYDIPKLPVLDLKLKDDFPSLSIIIPARNEAHNLPLLLEDLKKQSLTPLEIICVDDNSDDNTSEIAESFAVDVISLTSKPKNWLGKSWACYKGVQAAQGDLLLFLDADVRLGANALYRLLQEQKRLGTALSVQPYHQTRKNYEQFSLFFNLIQIAANGTASKNKKTIGFYGPLILMSQENYKRVGGHESVRQNIIEDVALGNRFNKLKIPYSLYVGDEDISFRMYAEGFRSLVQGWLKNQIEGAAQTPAGLFLKVFFWMGSLLAVPLQLIVFILKKNSFLIFSFSILYLAWLVIIFYYSRQIGDFRIWPIVLYPIPLLALLCIYLLAIINKIFKREVKWKGRSI